MKNELRIGNYVYYRGNIEKCFALRNSGVDFYRGKTKKGIITQGYTYDAIQPIPLTEEILLKCKGTLDGYIYNGWDDMQFFRFDEYSANMFELEICSDGFYYGCNKIEFLHDLQNCYYFHENIKKELTVNL